jgi:hypothetical protein
MDKSQPQSSSRPRQLCALPTKREADTLRTEIRTAVRAFAGQHVDLDVILYVQRKALAMPKPWDLVTVFLRSGLPTVDAFVEDVKTTLGR